MHIENFKGIQLFDISFGAVTNIIGRNGVGKTSLHDAYLWTLTGEDSNECSSFKVQPLEADGKTRKKVDTKVELVIEINGDEHTFSRELAQQWSTPRGTNEEVQGANTSSYFVDGLPKKYTEYKDLVKILLCDIDNFKLMSSLTAFCNLETKTRRRKLLEMAGQMPELINEKDYPNLYPLYKETKDVEGIKVKMSFDKKKLEAEHSSIPDKMTENERNLPTDIDFDALKARKEELEKAIANIDAKLQKSASSRQGVIAEIDAKKHEIFQLEMELTEIDGQLNRQITSKKEEISNSIIKATAAVNSKEQSINLALGRMQDIDKRLEAATARRQDLIDKWKAKNAETFDASVNDTCPTCGRKFTQEEIASMKDELVRAFNSGKTAVLKQIADEGSKAKAEMEGLALEKKELEADIQHQYEERDKLKTELSHIKASNDLVPTLDFLRSHNKEYQNILDKIEKKKSSLVESAPAIPEDEQKMKDVKAIDVAALEDVNKMLGQEVLIQKVADRRAELQREDEDLVTRIAQCTAVLSEIKDWEKANMLAVEEKVSSMFSLVTWKMYEKNLTNDGEKEICECLVEGVPYSTNLNTAKIVNAGIDIVNAISRWLGVVVPMWVDGKESVTELIPTASQLITLSVVEGAKLQVAPEGASF